MGAVAPSIGQFILTFGVAACMAATELVTTKYPRTARFALQSSYFYVYIVAYGLLGAVALALLPGIDKVELSGPGLSNPWVRAALVGFCIKAFMNINIFNVSTGPGSSYPVGMASLVTLFEPWLLKGLELSHYYRETGFIDPRAAKITDLAGAKERAIANIPTGFTQAEKAALTEDINKETSTKGVISVYLRCVGIRLTESTFPL